MSRSILSPCFGLSLTLVEVNHPSIKLWSRAFSLLLSVLCKFQSDLPTFTADDWFASTIFFWSQSCCFLSNCGLWNLPICSLKVGNGIIVRSGFFSNALTMFVINCHRPLSTSSMSVAKCTSVSLFISFLSSAMLKTACFSPTDTALVLMLGFLYNKCCFTKCKR